MLHISLRLAFLALFASWPTALTPVEANTQEIVCNPLHFGAIGDGITLDSLPVKHAVKACSGSSGGRVVFEPGKTFLLGEISITGVGIHVEVAKGSQLLASAERSHYGPRQDSWYLLDFLNCTGCSLSGGGTIKGCASAFVRHSINSYDGVGNRTDGRSGHAEVTNWRDPSCRARKQCRPRLVGVRRCHDVRIRNVHLADSAFWTLHILDSDVVHVFGVRVMGGMDFPNNDGIDIDGSSHVTVADSVVATADDAVCIKTTNGGARAVRHVLVRNCTLRSKSAAVKLGSESRADMTNLTFEHLTVVDSNRGLAIQLRDYGNVRDVIFQHVTVSTHTYPHGWWGAGEPLYVTALPRWLGSRVGSVSNVTFRNITGETRGGVVVLVGSPEGAVRDVALEDVMLTLAPSDAHVHPLALSPTGAERAETDTIAEAVNGPAAGLAVTGGPDRKALSTVWSQTAALDLRPGPYSVRRFMATAPVAAQFAFGLRLRNVTFVVLTRAASGHGPSDQASSASQVEPQPHGQRKWSGTALRRWGTHIANRQLERWEFQAPAEGRHDWLIELVRHSVRVSLAERVRVVQGELPATVMFAGDTELSVADHTLLCAGDFMTECVRQGSRWGYVQTVLITWRPQVSGSLAVVAFLCLLTHMLRRRYKFGIKHA